MAKSKAARFTPARKPTGTVSGAAARGGIQKPRNPVVKKVVGSRQPTAGGSQVITWLQDV